MRVFFFGKILLNFTERSFSKLSLIKNCLRTTMTNERLSVLCILDVESTVLKMNQFEAVLNDFVESKCRPKEFFLDHSMRKP